MKSNKRLLRRLHSKRLLKKAVKIQRSRWSINTDEKYLNECASKIKDNLTNCSCSMCCNPRHNQWLSNSEQLTKQERNNIIKFKEKDMY